jgi:glyoxylase-like metal-dependent hydrolase (beta-lactamase superfamily II)
MRSEQTLEFFDRKVPASPEVAWPDLTFDQEIVLHFNGEEIRIFQKGPGHTDTDCVVHFKNANLFHVGDLYFNGLYPYIGISSGGSVSDMVRVNRLLTEEMDGNTVVVPGHGPVSGKSEYSAYGQMLAVLMDRVTALIREGKSLEETVQAKPTQDYDDPWGKAWMKGDAFTKLLYMDLSRGK